MSFREAVRADDPDAIERLARATGSFNAEEVSIARELVEERVRHGAASGYEFLFAERGGRVAGYVCWGRIGGTRESWDLYWIAVDPSEQRRGLGRALLEACEARVRAAGGGRVYVETAGRADYAPTRAFYERTGYTLEATLTDYYAPGDAKCIYMKQV